MEEVLELKDQEGKVIIIIKSEANRKSVEYLPNNTKLFLIDDKLEGKCLIEGKEIEFKDNKKV